jgi:hypothetical protein
MELNPVLIDNGGPQPGDPYVFASNLGLDEQTLRAYKLCDAAGVHGPIARDELLRRCKAAESDNEIRGAILSVLAWGGMSHGNPQKFWTGTNKAESVICIIREMRCEDKNLDPVKAFSLFNTARVHGKLKYMGISFYTKILFFFFYGPPGTEAPILDQFVAKSLDLLFRNGSSRNAFTGSDGFPKEYASEESSGSMYRRYLECLDALRQEMELRTQIALSRSQVEWLLFRPGAWRNHVASS